MKHILIGHLFSPRVQYGMYWGGTLLDYGPSIRRLQQPADIQPQAKQAHELILLR